MTRASITDVMSSSVAEKALCWCEGRSTRTIRLRNPLFDWLPPDDDDVMKLRFYTERSVTFADKEIRFCRLQ